MFNLVLLLVTGLPLIGLIMMEGGAYGPDIYDFGHSNGASLAYVAHLVAMYGAYAFTFAMLGLAFPLRGGPEDMRASYSASRFRHLAIRALVLNVLLLAFVFFVSGASNVVFGLMDRGQFRTQARFGYVAFLCRDFLSPMLSALVAFVFVRCHRSWRDALLLGANLLVTAAAGAIWGYRAAVVMVILPASLILVRRMTITRGVALVAGGLALIVLSSTFYDGVPLRVAFNGVLTRASVGTANATWRVWDIEMTAPEVIPPYAPTLASAVGTRIRRVFGFDPDAPLDVSNPTDYSTLATLLAKNFSQGVDATSSVTTGVFGEAVVALGAKWFVLMSLAAGIVVAVVRAVFEYGQHN
ncbi:MAG: hypothetical protein ACRD15_10620, partial [Vicinamibacterales bacterium]